jgi:DNA-binding NtrC family response regulator
VSGYVLVVDDEARSRELYAETLRAAGLEVQTAADAVEARARIEAAVPSMVISDVRMPGEDGVSLLRDVRRAHELPFLLVTAHADVREAVAALKLGAVDYLAKPVDLDELVAAVTDAVGERPVGSDELPAEALQGIVGESPAFRAALRDAWRVAGSDATVLLTGESGTGKEVLAQFIHRHSKRARGPLVVVNCGAIPSTLLASELFGHEKGSFTGAIGKRSGRFREADGGTFFLDEMGELPLDLQPALLRAIETGRFTAVGADRETESNFRLIAATNRDLGKDVNNGRFREDLYYRINVIALCLPPLRERSEDILPLARHFLAQGASGPKRLSPAAARALQRHTWPGNVRELANAMERARLLSPGDVILPEHLPPALRQAAEAPLAAAPSESENVRALELVERDSIAKALEKTEGNRTRAAELLGISRRTLIYKLKRYGLR